MSLIGFLESLGRDADLRHATRDELKWAMPDLDVESQRLLQVEDRPQVEALLGVKASICCGLVPGREDEEEEEEPGKEDEEIRSRTHARAA